MSLPTRKIGNTQVAALGFGHMGLSMGYGAVGTDEERLQFLDGVFERGCTNWDTADSYGRGDSETLIGKWFARTGKRKDIFLATKFGLADPKRFPNGEPTYAKEECNASLARLQTDYVDLYYLHRADPKVPIEKTVAAMAELVKEGKVKYLGLSEVSAATLRRAHAVHPIAALQVEYSAIELSIESDKVDLLRTARELGVTVVAYSPLGRGLLTGQYKSAAEFPEGDFRRMIPRFSEANFPHILALADGLAKIATVLSATAGQVALAWLLAQGDNIIPIPGTKKLKYLDENIGALKLTLTESEVAAVRVLADKAMQAVVGERLPPAYNALTYGDTPELE
ncbi:Aldo/keto reductase [Auriscalpium vulgare]|uniref:Aldo/keto reductase n=1 Tax=Auriscalpium vulgare TaxID=40419 RepID=A0ACB8RJR0_9AGAM|nr:Aldo/keto reductase [Auriscalpium vulgare]